MSIASELTNLRTNISNAYDAINTKGGTMPTNKNTANLASAISSIAGGLDLSAIYNFTKAVSGEITDLQMQFVTIPHNMGVLPRLVYFVKETPANTAPSYPLELLLAIQTGNMDENNRPYMESGILFQYWYAGKVGNENHITFFSSKNVTSGTNATITSMYDSTRVSIPYAVVYGGTTTSVSLSFSGATCGYGSKYKYLIMG